MHMLTFCLLLCSLVSILVFRCFHFWKNVVAYGMFCYGFLFFLVSEFGDCYLH
jgi:hypothetical protein